MNIAILGAFKARTDDVRQDLFLNGVEYYGIGFQIQQGQEI